MKIYFKFEFINPHIERVVNKNELWSKKSISLFLLQFDMKDISDDLELVYGKIDACL